MRFKELSIGAMFEFDHNGIQFSGIAVGPWIKLSARQYTACNKENNLYGYRLTVGSINVHVVEP